MVAGSVVLFFAEKAGEKALDMLLDRITGESRRRRELETTVAEMNQRQQEMLELLYEQLEAHFTVGLRSLQAAARCDLISSSYRDYLRDAVHEFTYCASLNHFSGLRKAQILVYLAACQWLRQESSTVLSTLREARNVASGAAVTQHEVYVREETSQALQLTLPSGTVVTGVQWTRRDVPQMRDGALELVRQLDEAIRYVEQHRR